MSLVLVATAGEETDRDAIREALGLLGDGHSYLFLGVYQAMPGVAMSGFGTMVPTAMPTQDVWDATTESGRSAAHQHLQETLDALGLSGEVRVEQGDPAERICTTAVEEHVDLIVVCDHHHSMLSRLLGGSTTDDVAHHAPCPVLLARQVQQAEHQ
jgi:nucleotide-binding universal stress UspA family protein